MTSSNWTSFHSFKITLWGLNWFGQRCQMITCGTSGDPDIELRSVSLEPYPDTWANIWSPNHLHWCPWRFKWPSQIFYILQRYLHLWSIMYSLFNRHICCFSSVVPIPFEIVHLCISIHNANAYVVLSGSHKYFSFGSHICSFTIYTLLGRHVCFFLPIMSITFNTVLPYEPINICIYMDC